MTEDEAKTKWCPFVRTPDSGYPNSVAVNRAATVQPKYNCIASDCMMWVGEDLYRYEDGLSTMPRYRGVNGKLEHHGSCGLINK